MSKYRYPGYPSKIKLEPPPEDHAAASTSNALPIKDEEKEDVEMGVASGLVTVDAFAKSQPEDEPGPAFSTKHEEILPSSPKYDVSRSSPQPKEEPKHEDEGEGSREGQALDASDLFKDDPFQPSASTSTSHSLKPDPDDEGEEEIDEPETSLEPSPDPNLDDADADIKPSPSKSTKRGKGGKGGKAGGGEEKTGPQLIGHLPKAEEDAMKTFTEMTRSHYQYATLGRSREALESMTCDCVYDPSACFFSLFSFAFFCLLLCFYVFWSGVRSRRCILYPFSLHTRRGEIFCMVFPDMLLTFVSFSAASAHRCRR